MLRLKKIDKSTEITIECLFTTYVAFFVELQHSAHFKETVVRVKETVHLCTGTSLSNRYGADRQNGGNYCDLVKIIRRSYVYVCTVIELNKNPFVSLVGWRSATMSKRASMRQKKMNKKTNISIVSTPCRSIIVIFGWLLWFFLGRKKANEQATIRWPTSGHRFCHQGMRVPCSSRRNKHQQGAELCIGAICCMVPAFLDGENNDRRSAI
jgi:hypothetical protein